MESGIGSKRLATAASGSEAAAGSAKKSDRVYVCLNGGPHRERESSQSSPYSMAPGNLESGVWREFPPLIREAALPRTLRGRGPVRCLMPPGGGLVFLCMRECGSGVSRK